MMKQHQQPLSLFFAGAKSLLLLLAVLPAALSLDVASSTSGSNIGAEYTTLSSQDLSELPLPERTVPGALRLCQHRSPGRFCAWLTVDPATELVTGGACFNEAATPCNKIGYTGGKNSKRYRYLTCSGCDSCASQRAACPPAATNCSLLCYCSCGRAFNSVNASQGQFHNTGDDWHFAYPCSGVCDGTAQCPYGQDEHTSLCTGLYTSANTWSMKGFTEFTQTVTFKLIIVAVIFGLICLVLFGLNNQYQWLPWLATQPKFPHGPNAAAAFAVSQQHQQQLQASRT